MQVSKFQPLEQNCFADCRARPRQSAAKNFGVSLNLFAALIGT